MSGQITAVKRGHVTVLTFASPPHNHATVPLLRALGDALDLADEDPECRALVLQSEGRIFCAGADLAAPGDGMGGSSGDPVLEFYTEATRIFRNRKPIVAAIQGAAIGAGLGLAVAADFRIATPDARFSANFVALGFHPGFGLTHTLPRLVGEQRSARMFLTGARIKAEEALAWGLVDQLVPAQDLSPAALAFASDIARNAPLALLDTRETIRAGLSDAVAEALQTEYAKQSRLKQTADYAEGVAAVFERREAHFTGR